VSLTRKLSKTHRADVKGRSVNATTRDFHGFTSIMSFSRLVLSASTLQNIPPSRAIRLPPRFAALPLIHRYLHSIFAILPFFTETSIFASIEVVYGGRGSDLDHWTVNMILAISSSLVSRRRGDTEYRNAEGYVAAALERADGVLTPGSIAGIQAILLLVIYAMLDPAHFDSWYLIGIASRAAVDIGLHHDPPKQLMLSKAQLDRRRSVFYCVYTLDRLVTTSLFIPCFEGSNTDQYVGQSAWLMQGHFPSLTSRPTSLYLRYQQNQLRTISQRTTELGNSLSIPRSIYFGCASSNLPGTRTFFSLDASHWPTQISIFLVHVKRCASGPKPSRKTFRL
jgi:Fungal specific transcription factor domain